MKTTKLYSKNSFLTAIFLSLLLGGCSSLSNRTSKLKLTQDTFLSVDGQSRVLHSKGSVVDVEDRPILIEAPGHVGILLVPFDNSKSSSLIESKLKPIDEWSGETLEKSLNIKLSEIVSETIQVQILLSSKNVEEALAKIDLLQLKYPKITYLNLLRASALYLKGEVEKSKLAVEIALKDFPTDINARRFYESIGGKIIYEPQKSPDSQENKSRKKADKDI